MPFLTRKMSMVSIAACRGDAQPEMSEVRWNLVSWSLLAGQARYEASPAPAGSASLSFLATNR